MTRATVAASHGRPGRGELQRGVRVHVENEEFRIPRRYRLNRLSVAPNEGCRGLVAFGLGLELSDRRSELLVRQVAPAMLAGQPVNLVVELGLRPMPRRPGDANWSRRRRRGLGARLNRTRLVGGPTRTHGTLQPRQNFVVFVGPIADAPESGQMLDLPVEEPAQHGGLTASPPTT